jgi:hypothetical protein
MKISRTEEIEAKYNETVRMGEKKSENIEHVQNGREPKRKP